MDVCSKVATDSDSIFSLAKTPINLGALKEALQAYPNTKVAEEIATGFEFGFPLHYTGSRRPRESKNLKSASDHPEIVKQKLQSEIQQGRMAGPFPMKPISTMRISPIGLVEKKTPGEYRLIHHLSYPEGDSVNDCIDPTLCTVHYTSFDEAIHMIQDMGQNCLMAKGDIKSAFRLIPVEVSSFDQMGIKFQDNYYFDKAMPFGCSISCATWEKVANFLEFCIKQRSPVGNVKHYVDDFLFAGKANKSDCATILQCFFDCTKELGVPIASEKTEGPKTSIIYLGLEIDSVEMVVRMPMQKVQEIISKIRFVKDQKKVTLKCMQQLIGVLNFATRVIVPGRPFLRRLINATCGLTKPFHHLRVTKVMKQDLDMWLRFFDNYNGISIFHDRFWVSNADVELFTDSAAGEGLGFGAIYGNQWTHGIWPESWHSSGLTNDITVLEAFPILVCLVLWGSSLTNKKILFRSDNESVTHILNTMTSRSANVMVLLRAITLQCMEHNIVIKSKHIEGKKNTLSDCLSRCKLQKFHQLAPEAEQQPVMLPNQLWKIFN